MVTVFRSIHLKKQLVTVQVAQNVAVIVLRARSFFLSN